MKSGILISVRPNEEEEGNAKDDNQAESSLPPIPHVRLPHQKPLPADGDKPTKPQDDPQCQAGDCDALGLIEAVRVGSRPEEARPTPPAQNRSCRLCQNDDPIQKVMHEGSVDGAPHRPIVGKGRVHFEDMDNKPIVGVIVGEVVEYDEDGEKRDGPNECDFGVSRVDGTSERLLGVVTNCGANGYERGAKRPWHAAPYIGG